MSSATTVQASVLHGIKDLRVVSLKAVVDEATFRLAQLTPREADKLFYLVGISGAATSRSKRSPSSGPSHWAMWL